jgi:hypothetical protein
MLPGEKLETEWLAASGIDGTFEKNGSLPFGNEEKGGGKASRIEYPAGSGNHVLLLEETTAGEQSNWAVNLYARLSVDSAFAKRINEILAKPEGEPPVWFSFSFKAAQVSRASRLVHGLVQLNFEGNKSPFRNALTGDTSLRRHPAVREQGLLVPYDSDSYTPFRFAVTPSGGKSQVNTVALVFALRVDGGSSPEAWAIDDLAVHEISGTPAPSDSPTKLAFVGSRPAVAFLRVAHEMKLQVLPVQDENVPAEAQLIVANRKFTDRFSKTCIAALDRGASIVFGLPDEGKPPAELSARLPANLWTVERNNLRRYDTSVVPAPGSTWPKTAELSVPWRWDLHLPFAPIESGLHRYYTTEFQKGLLNTDWQFHLSCGVDGGLPMLVSGRSGPGRAFVFASDLFSPMLAGSPGYGAFAAELLRVAAGDREGVCSAYVSSTVGLSLSIPRHQPNSLSVIVENKSKEATKVLLTYKIANWTRELLNAETKELNLAAGQTLTVPLRERSPLLGAEDVHRSGDDAIPMRRVFAGLATLDRSKLLVESAAAVSIEPVVALDLEEDTRTYADLKDWPDNITPDGVEGYRYVYRTGVSPVWHVSVRNGLINVAPLATAEDVNWKENPSTNGLNDLSYSHSSVRGGLPLQAAWSGKQAAEQKVRLTWDAPVTVTAQRLVGFGSYRFWERSNPKQYTVTDGAKELAKQTEASFVTHWGDRNAYHDLAFNPTTLTTCNLQVTGLDPKQNYEPRHAQIGNTQTPVNCSLMEWELYGWPDAKAPAKVSGTLKFVAKDLLSGKETVVLDEKADIEGLAKLTREVTIPARNAFGPVRVDVSFTTAGTKATKCFDMLFVPAEGRKLLNKEKEYDVQRGLLCSPGWVQTNDFGLGMRKHTQGWGGPHDKLWAWEYNLTECGTRNRDNPARMLVTCQRLSHYTNPWRTFLDGEYSWDWVVNETIRDMNEGRYKGKGKRLHIVGSDRWNGLNVGSAWGWSEFILFDEHLKKTRGKGLEGRSRGQIVDEICSKYGDEWQRWAMNRYADKVLESQENFKKAGITFTFETHGSFPLAGGELGGKLAKTHIAVGTDLFWELRNQDLIWSLGTRFGIVAANPDLRSGAYGQWGWDNSDLNCFWFANNGSVESARRQWYAAYFAGRVTLDGTYQPYHVYGFGSQGSHGVQLYLDDIREFARATNLMSQVRPEEPTGFGIVVSWAEQERHMGPKLTAQGFGLYAGDGYEQIDDLMGHVYHKLVKNGAPISFVTSTHGLKKWNGKQPLVLVDGYNYEDWELEAIERLNKAGAPILAIGAPEDGDRAHAAKFFGAALKNGTWTTATGTREVPFADAPLAFVTKRNGSGPVVYCPYSGRELPGRGVPLLLAAFMKELGDPLTLPTGVALTPFVSQKALFLGLSDLGDDARNVSVSLKPSFFLPALKSENLRVIDLDRAIELPAKWDAGRLTFTLPVAASAGRMVVLMEGEK